MNDPLSEGQAWLRQKITEALQAGDQRTPSVPSHLRGDHSSVTFISERWPKIYVVGIGMALPRSGNHAGNHRVVKRGDLHFKLSPGGGYDDEGAINDIRPGMEWAISSFFKRLCLDGQAKALVLLAPSSTLVVFNDIQVKNLEANIKQTNSPYLWVLDRVMTGRDSCFEEV